MASTTQTEKTVNKESEKVESPSEMIFTVVGLFLVTLLVWFTIKGKLRDWFMK